MTLLPTRDLWPPGRPLLLALLAGLALAACGSQSANEPAVTADAGDAVATAGAATDRPGAAAGTAIAFQATLTGARQMGIEGSTALAGTAYRLYQLSFGGQGMAGEGPVLVSLARDDTSAPTAGSYTLGDDADFSGTVEIYPGPAEYGIDSGELVISGARGDVLSGSFTLTAVEPEGGTRITVNGRFHTRAAH